MQEIDKTPQQGPMQDQIEKSVQRPPLWAAAVGTLLLGVIYAVLPSHLTIGPTWLPLVIILLLMLPIVIAELISRPLPYVTKRALSFITLGVVTAALIVAVILLVITLPSRTQSHASLLLREAILLWIANILVFSLWYWEIDGGGPHQRHKAGHKAADFLFPQQQVAQVPGHAKENWAPHFLDYCFVAFTGATALSPADTFPLTRKAKMLMIIEAVISMTVVILLAARAVNIL